jgi:membrane protein implicated in regulation of membrane protease activity
MGKRPANKIVALGSIALLLSVAFVSAMISNPFNTVMFLLASILFIYITWKMPAEKLVLKWDVASVSGIVMIVFGLVYPHFLEEGSWLRYLYASPLGLIPCPTLSLIIGFTLLFHGFFHKKWMLSLGLTGLFYGIFGVLRLKVYLDVVLISGALILLVFALTRKEKRIE